MTLGVTPSHFEGDTPHKNSRQCMGWGQQQTSSSSIPRPLPGQWQVSARGTVAVPGWRGMKSLPDIGWPRAGPGVQQGYGGALHLPCPAPTSMGHTGRQMSRWSRKCPRNSHAPHARVLQGLRKRRRARAHVRGHRACW